MTRLPALLCAVALLAACGGKQPPVDSGFVSYHIDAGRITVSGVSSGAYMAGQLHVAHSSLISGAALLAGGPYRCAEASLTKALGPCMKGGDVGLDGLLAYARDAAASGWIDPLDNLADDPVWIFHGAADTIMHADTSDAAAAMYESLLSGGGVIRVSDVDVVHGFPTLATGAACDEFRSPYLNSCGYDAAGELLRALYGELDDRRPAGGQLLDVAQPGGSAAQMPDRAFLYVPQSCAAGASCGVHVALHGCLQSREFVGDAFATGAGYNEWAEANDLLVLYPQVGSSKFAPLNPNGCWDWWGYTGENYATRDGGQTAVIKSMLDALAGTTL